MRAESAEEIATKGSPWYKVQLGESVADNVEFDLHQNSSSWGRYGDVALDVEAHVYDAGTVQGVTGSSVNPIEAVVENQDVWS